MDKCGGAVFVMLLDLKISDNKVMLSSPNALHESSHRSRIKTVHQDLNIHKP